MIMIIALTFLAVLVQVILAPLPIFGLVPLIGLLTAVWLGYRYGPMAGVISVLLVGWWLSFFSIDPSATLLAYILVSVVVLAGISLSSDEQKFSKLWSLFVVLLSSWLVILISNAGSFGALSSPQIITLFMVTGLTSLVVWVSLIFFADPKHE